MKRFAAALAVTVAAIALASTAQADPSAYGIKEASASTSTNQAVGHPDFNTFFELNTEEVGSTKQLPSTTRVTRFSLPPGLLGNPGAVPTCSAAQLIGTNPDDKSNETGCPQGSQVGIAEVQLFKGFGVAGFTEPIFNMEPGYGEPARFGFIADVYPVFIDTELQPEREYAVTARVEGISSLIPLLSADTTFWGVPAAETHDAQRITPYETVHNNGVPETPTGKRSAGLVPVPFMLNPSRCGVSQGIGIVAIPYALPELEREAFAPLSPNTGCGLPEFKPDISVVPTATEAETGTGLNVELSFPTDGLENPSLLAEAEQRKVEVTLPEGVTVNPSEASGGLGVCSSADYARETASSGIDQGCPETSKIGSVSATTPLLKEPLEGSLFLAKPHENPFDTLLAIYLVLKAPERGVIVKLAGRVEPDPRTGQLVTTFDDIPQAPVSHFTLHFREGARAPLVTPPHCGTYASTATFTAWTGRVVTTNPTFQIDRGVGGGPCPQGVPPFEPGFEAGSLNNNAGSHSPFYMRLTRRDGDQDLTRFSAKLPPGMVAKLAGVAECPDAAIEAARSKSGKAEQTDPSCPAASAIGHVSAGAGVGSVLTYADGTIYLAGPYQGAPLSVAAIVPAVAGPFDVGTVVTRQALQLNPRTGVVTADGAHSDPIPHILAGIPLKVRDIRVYVDRPDFTLNPTSCDPFAVEATLWAGGNNVFSSLDDAPTALSARFQAANCSLLGFKPSLALTLKGGSKRAGHPALTGVYKPRPGDANLADLVLRLPHSAFLDQAHIRTICTRVQFAAKACPAGAVYGRARAFTPLLAEPLEGPVYLRSSNHNLPDFVADLHGLVDVEAVARIDSFQGGIRATFTDVPDAPLSKVVVQMQGAKKGLIVNSTNLCVGRHRAAVQLEGHNGKQAVLHPETKADCGRKRRSHHHDHP